MGLGHEKLDVYRLSIGYVAWVYQKTLSAMPWAKMKAGSAKLIWIAWPRCSVDLAAGLTMSVKSMKFTV